jgi:hypothetical protein
MSQVILRRHIVYDGKKHNALVVAAAMRNSILKHFHDDPVASGHVNYRKICANLKLRFFWEGMTTDV